MWYVNQAIWMIHPPFGCMHWSIKFFMEIIYVRLSYVSKKCVYYLMQTHAIEKFQRFVCVNPGRIESLGWLEYQYYKSTCLAGHSSETITDSNNNKNSCPWGRQTDSLREFWNHRLPPVHIPMIALFNTPLSVYIYVTCLSTPQIWGSLDSW